MLPNERILELPSLADQCRQVLTMNAEERTRLQRKHNGAADYASIFLIARDGSRERTMRFFPVDIPDTLEPNGRAGSVIALLYLAVREMKCPMLSFKDLAFLIPEDWKPGDPLPVKFLTSSTASPILSRLLNTSAPVFRPSIDTNKMVSPEFKEPESDALKTGKIWGLMCTDSFEMWRSTCDMCTLWQRLGRAAPALHLMAKGLFLVEPKRFDANIGSRAKPNPLSLFLNGNLIGC
ncbi:hypothetical protein B0H13DRAFT_2341838 [Mycena leptocephala]|nr:hypothetical protein B0H13DRAFT_2341838 [Mycena leptocephala]